MIRIMKHQKRVLLEKGEERMAKKRFNITGLCVPDRHYMVDLSSRLREIRELVDEGAYFVISRARQYGKTTMLHAMAKNLADDYFVVRLDFQVLGSASYKDENTFSRAFASCFIKAAEFYDERAGEEYPVLGRLRSLEKRESSDFDLRRLFQLLQEFCRTAAKPVVLMVDEIDSAQNNQVFLDFLAQLRNYYLEREAVGAPTFQSVILAGVYDVKNLKRKIRQEEEQKVNSPWITREDNEPSKSGLLLGDCPRDHMVLVPYDIAAKFKVNMSFSQKDIAGMLGEYEKDYHTGMDIDEMAGYIYNDTSGYPFLVSELCKLIDEEVCGMEGLENREAAWTKEGFLEAEHETFIEDTGRKFFLLYLRPIINGTGNYYVEAQTRDLGRTDVIVDFHGEQFVIEMKVWHGNEYNKRGEKQLLDYLDAYHKNKGYMLSFNFNKKKSIGVHEIAVGDKILIEAVV